MAVGSGHSQELGGESCVFTPHTGYLVCVPPYGSPTYSSWGGTSPSLSGVDHPMYTLVCAFPPVSVPACASPTYIRPRVLCSLPREPRHVYSPCGMWRCPHICPGVCVGRG